MNKENAWIKEFPAAATVCDPDGIILEMNDKAAKSPGEGWRAVPWLERTC